MTVGRGGSSGVGGRRILIVDDDPGIRSVLADLLADEGYATLVASDGAEALEVLSRTTVDVVLLDMRMPGMDGWEFSRRYRNFPGPRAPILVMTAAQDAWKWSEEIGAEGCLAKPFEYDAILDALKKVG